MTSTIICNVRTSNHIKIVQIRELLGGWEGLGGVLVLLKLYLSHIGLVKCPGDSK